MGKLEEPECVLNELLASSLLGRTSQGGVVKAAEAIVLENDGSVQVGVSVAGLGLVEADQECRGSRVCLEQIGNIVAVRDAVEARCTQAFLLARLWFGESLEGTVCHLLNVGGRFFVLLDGRDLREVNGVLKRRESLLVAVSKLEGDGNVVENVGGSDLGAKRLLLVAMHLGSDQEVSFSQIVQRLAQHRLDPHPSLSIYSVLISPICSQMIVMKTKDSVFRNFFR